MPFMADLPLLPRGRQMSRPYSEVLRPSSCRHKNHYPTTAMAEPARLRQQERYGWLFETYKCRYCDEFHLARIKVNGHPVPILGWTER